MPFIEIKPEIKTIEFYGNEISFREPLAEELVIISQIEDQEVKDQLNVMFIQIEGWYSGEENGEFSRWLQHMPLSKIEELMEKIVGAFVGEVSPKKLRRSPSKSP